MTSMQGLSGAGRSPGVVALDILDNIIPYIPKEEEKVAKETGKILGRRRRAARIAPHAGRRSAPPAPARTCSRATPRRCTVELERAGDLEASVRAPRASSAATSAHAASRRRRAA